MEEFVGDTQECHSVCCTFNTKPYQPTEALLHKSEREFITKGVKRKLSFLPKWYGDYKWLRFCTARNKAMSYICCEAQRRKLITFSKNAEAFTPLGFNNWKKATKRFKDHEQCSAHREAVVKLAETMKNVEILE